ncbi:factor H binding protein domain-containing protein [Neisseria lactamica]|uniref:factor H binding protein domain-containing protein n=1 Tax=Neisseria lactamica TaxID=486 RepID=UPI001EFE1FEE|nr:factor H binding protein domain-containing protein [Neisseria lactamica]
MTLNKVFALSMIALGLAACSSNGTANNGNNSLVSGAGVATQGAVVTSFYSVKEGVRKDVRDWATQKGFKPTDVELTSVTLQVGNVSSNGKNINLFDVVPAQKQVQKVDTVTTARVKAGGDNYELITKGRAHIYRQNYSLIAGLSEREKIEKDPSGIERNLNVDDDVDLVMKGSATKILPSKGNFSYSGIATAGEKQGALSYTVDFENKKGKGTITGIDNDITLNEAPIKEFSHTNEIDNTVIKGHGIQGSSNRGDYKLGFFGPNAEEIVGAVTDGTNSIGFAGSRPH